MRDIHVIGVTCQKSKYALQLRGLAASPIRDVYLVDCEYNGAAEPSVIDHVDALKQEHVRVNGHLV